MKYYTEAITRFIDYSSNDATAAIAREHGLIGLTRIIACLDNLGLSYDDTYMIALPDFTFTRNKNRWDAGFPYGCIIQINNDANKPFIPIDFRPNCCGVIFAEIPKFNETLKSLSNRYFKIIQKLSNLDTCDLNRRNHFIGIYYSEITNKYYCLIHCSFKFVKEKLYQEHNKKLVKDVNTFNYMSGSIHYFYGNAAIEYYNSYLKLEQDTLVLREMILKELFPDANILFHQTHEGFFNINTILLGAYANDNTFEYPLMLCPNSNVYITSVNKAIKTSCKNHFFCAPHGGGYEISLISTAQKYNNEYLLEYPNQCQFLTNNIIDMPFNYRNNITFDLCEKHRIGKIVNTLKPLINLKL